MRRRNVSGELGLFNWTRRCFKYCCVGAPAAHHTCRSKSYTRGGGQSCTWRWHYFLSLYRQPQCAGQNGIRGTRANNGGPEENYSRTTGRRVGSSLPGKQQSLCAWRDFTARAACTWHVQTQSDRCGRTARWHRKTQCERTGHICIPQQLANQ